MVNLPPILFALGAVLAAVALARPRTGDERTVVRSEGIAIELVVDVSSSMLALDLSPRDGPETTRLDVVKQVVREFVAGDGRLAGRPADLVGLTVFAGYADALCPLTLDHRLLLDTLDSTRTAMSRYEDGTSIGQGLAVALGRLRDSTARSRVAIVLTDGSNNDAETDPRAVAKVAQEMGVKVYTVGVGSEGIANIRFRDDDGVEQLRQMRVEIDEALLTEIADTTGAIYQRADSTEALRNIYAEIDRLERTEHEGITYRRWNEWFALPLAAGALCFVVAMIGEATWLRRAG
jgi:Ca-activated chloride channel family protein